MADKRSQKELTVIRLLFEAEGLDPQHVLANEQCDLVEVARILAGVRDARGSLSARKI